MKGEGESRPRSYLYSMLFVRNVDHMTDFAFPLTADRRVRHRRGGGGDNSGRRREEHRGV